jgi:hypothetical protein
MGLEQNQPLNLFAYKPDKWVYVWELKVLYTTLKLDL